MLLLANAQSRHERSAANEEPAHRPGCGRRFCYPLTIQDYLDEAGFEVLEAEDGEAGVAVFESRHVDIVVLDVIMPKLDGFGVCERLRAHERGHYVPILMMTGNDDMQSVRKAFEAGATDFSTKPINPELLVHRVHYMLRSKHTADRLRQRERNLAYAQRIARLGNSS